MTANRAKGIYSRRESRIGERMKNRRSAEIFTLFLLFALTALSCASFADEVKRIAAIRVVGNEKLKESYIINILGIKIGDTYTDDKIAEWKEKLKRLAAVENAIIRAFPSADNSEVRLFIVISEQATRKISPAILRGVNNKWSFGLSYSDTDFRGRDERVKLKGLLGGTTLLEALWGKEAAYGINYVGFLFRARYNDYTYVFKDYSRYLLDDRIRNVEGSLEISIFPLKFMKLILATGVDIYDLADPMLESQGTKDIPDAPKGIFSTLEYGLEINMLNRSSYPESGFLLKASRKDWGVFTRNSKIKNFVYKLKGVGALKIGKPILALRASSIITGGRAPLMFIQHIGGEGTVRGYEFGSISGSSSAVATAELHMPLNFSDFDDSSNPLVLTDAHIFLDTGACWSEAKALTRDTFYSGFGLGLSLIPSPSTVLLIDYAWTLNSSGRWQIDVRSSF